MSPQRCRAVPRMAYVGLRRGRVFLLVQMEVLGLGEGRFGDSVRCLVKGSPTVELSNILICQSHDHRDREGNQTVRRRIKLQYSSGSDTVFEHVNYTIE